LGTSGGGPYDNTFINNQVFAQSNAVFLEIAAFDNTLTTNVLRSTNAMAVRLNSNTGSGNVFIGNTLYFATSRALFLQND